VNDGQCPRYHGSPQFRIADTLQGCVVPAQDDVGLGGTNTVNESGQRKQTGNEERGYGCRAHSIYKGTWPGSGKAGSMDSAPPLILAFNGASHCVN
jgi:hypothetical protein